MYLKPTPISIDKLAANALAMIIIDVNDNNCRSTRGQRQRCSAPDALPTVGDDKDFVSQTHNRIVSIAFAKMY